MSTVLCKSHEDDIRMNFRLSSVQRFHHCPTSGYKLTADKICRYYKAWWNGDDEGKAFLQSRLGHLADQTCLTKKPFSTAKCKVMHVGTRQEVRRCVIRNSTLENNTLKRIRIVRVWSNFTPTRYCGKKGEINPRMHKKENSEQKYQGALLPFVVLVRLIICRIFIFKGC